MVVTRSDINEFVGGNRYILGNEEDKRRSEEQAARERAALANSRLTDDAGTNLPADPTQRPGGQHLARSEPHHR